MRIHGWCSKCRKPKLVRVSNHGLAMMAVRRVPEGICDQCERAEQEERKARYRR